jgi:O-antigen/teichoic acid export membrane protein
VKLLAKKDYWAGISIIPPIVLSNFVIFAYTLYVNVEHFFKNTIPITINTVIAAVVNIVLNFLCIPKFGYVAAAYTTIVAYMIALLLHANNAKKLEKDLYPIRVFKSAILQLSFTVIVFYIFKEQWYIRWTFLAVYFVFMAIINKKLIKEVLPLFLKR